MFVIYQYTERQLNEIEIKYIAVHVCAAIERKKNKEVAFRVIVACHEMCIRDSCRMEWKHRRTRH